MPSTTITPCTRVAAFQGRFRALVADPESSTDSFSFRFHFLHGAQDVLVQLTKPNARPAGNEKVLVFMTVSRVRIAADRVISSTGLGRMSLDSTARARGMIGTS